MAREPAVPPSDGGAEAGARERFGPLALERLAKADGRALIVYSRAEPPASEAAPPQRGATPEQRGGT
jgi:hypothetical protein